MVEIFSNISRNYWVMITNVTESREKRKNTLLNKFLASHFVLLYYVFFALVLKTFFLHQNVLVILKPIFFLNSVQGAR
jgi:hypothetical protein